MNISQETIYKNYGEYLIKVLPIYSWYVSNLELTIVIPFTHLKCILNFLSKHTLAQYEMLSDIICIDYPSRGTHRFEVVYQLLSIRYNVRIKVKIVLPENISIESVISIFKNANWSEREVYDMFGIFFKNHTDLRRILTDYGFEGHPFRKDFPLIGFKEIKYDIAKLRILYSPVELDQQLRNLI